MTEIGVDFAALHERRLRDEARLQQMLSLARARECRRNRILRHFGEEIPERTCGRCDPCEDSANGSLKRHEAPRKLTEHELTTVRMILAGVARAKGRCGRQRIIQMLQGSQAQPVTELGLDRLSTHGLLRHLKRAAIRELFDRLEEASCLRQVGDRFPVIHLTSRGQRVMLEEEEIELALPFQRAHPAPSTGPDAACPGGGNPDEGDYDEELFQRLRQLRLSIAQELGVPAYRVFNDRTLRAMAREKPNDPESLREIPGVGERTYASFGEAFLEEINARTED